MDIKHTPFDHSGEPEDSSARRAIVIIADGWKKSNFLTALEAGDLPEISEHVIEQGGVVSNIVSNIPSVSIASHASLLTSEYQDSHGIPGHRWMADADCSCHDYLRIGGPRAVNDDLSRDVQTVFEAAPMGFRTIAVQSIISRGAEIYSRVPSLRSTPILRKLGSLIMEHPKSISVAWLPRGDSLSHVHGPESRLVRDDMIETSRAIGELAGRLMRGGVWDSTDFLLVPDHGHRAVRKQTDIKQALQNAGIDAAVNARRAGTESLAMTSGDSSAYIYLSRSHRHRALECAQSIAQQRGIELSCFRPAREEAFFFSKSGSAHVFFDENWFTYRLLDGHDPLGLTRDEASVAMPLSSLSPGGHYPDFLHQYYHSHVDGRSSPLLVFAEKDTHFGRGPRIGWRLGFHRGTHGGPFEDEVVVAGAYKGPNRSDLDQPVRSAELLRHLGMLASAQQGHCRAAQSHH